MAVDFTRAHAQNTGGSQLEGQRHTLQAAAQRRDIAGIVGGPGEVGLPGPGTFDEQPLGICFGQRPDLHHLFRLQFQGSPRRHDALDAPGGLQQLADRVGRVGNLLRVIQEQQQLPLLEEGPELFLDRGLRPEGKTEP